MYACLNMKDLEFIILEETEENWNKMAKQPPKTKQKKKKKNLWRSPLPLQNFDLKLSRVLPSLELQKCEAANQPVTAFCVYMGRLSSMVIQITERPQPLLRDSEELADRV